MINKQKFRLIIAVFTVFCLFGLTGAVSAAEVGNNSTVNETINDSSNNKAGLADTAWPKFQNDLNNTGQSEYNGPQNNTTQWTYTTPNAMTQNSNVAIGSDGTIYFGVKNSNYLYAVYANGTEKWKLPVASQVYSVAIGKDGTIYAGSGGSSQYLFAIIDNGTNGILKWTYSAGGSVRGIAIGSDGTLYFGSQVAASGYKLNALMDNGTNCVLKWVFLTNGTIYGTPAIGSDGTIYIACNDQNIYALVDNGTSYILKWSYLTGGLIQASPSIGDDGTIYIGTADNKIYALIDNGTQAVLKWTYTTGAIVVSSAVMGADGTAYIGSNDGNVYALNPDGSLKWKYTIGGSIFNLVIAQNGAIYVGGNVVGNYKLISIKDVAPVADFEANATNITPSSPIQFTDNSTGNPTTWTWDFNNDGIIDSTLQNPTYSYTTPGVYSVKLVVTNNNGYDRDEEVKTNYITVLDVTPPVVSANIPGGKYNTKLNINLTSNELVTIYYTTDGSIPTNNSMIYSGPISLTKTTTLKFFAVDSAGNPSNVSTEVYTIDNTSPSAWASVKGGAYNTNKVVSLSMSESGVIYYTLDGSTPSKSSKKYTGPITISSSVKLRFIAIDDLGNPSSVYTQNYIIDKTGPKVTVTSPKNGAKKVSKTSTITITFNETIKKGVNWSKVFMKNLKTGKWVSISKWISGNSLKIKMKLKRYPSTLYAIYIPAYAFKDAVGNKQAKGYTLKFRT
jgi:outer membrane protein assembly factor BamB